MSGEDLHDEQRLRFTVGALKMICSDLGKSAGQYTRETIAAVTAPLERQIKELQQRVEQLEGRKYCGVWREHETYHEGASATYRNGLWFCRAATTTARPGASKDWQLASRGGLGED